MKLAHALSSKHAVADSGPGFNYTQSACAALSQEPMKLLWYLQRRIMADRLMLLGLSLMFYKGLKQFLIYNTFFNPTPIPSLWGGAKWPPTVLLIAFACNV